MGAAQADDEPSGIGRFQLRVEGGNIRGWESVDGEDRAPNAYLARGAYDVGQLLQVLEWAARYPDCRVPQPFQLSNRTEERFAAPGIHHHTNGTELEPCHRHLSSRLVGHPPTVPVTQQRTRFFLSATAPDLRAQDARSRASSVKAKAAGEEWLRRWTTRTWARTGGVNGRTVIPSCGRMADSARTEAPAPLRTPGTRPPYDRIHGLRRETRRARTRSAGR